MLKNIPARVEETCNAEIFSPSHWKGRPGSAMFFVALLSFCATYLSRTGMFLCDIDGRSELKPTRVETHVQLHLGGLQLHNGTQEVDEYVESRRPQRLLELPYAEQKGSWIGNQWVPPDGWRYFSAKEMQTFYKDKSVMFIGDSLARRAAATMYGILKEAANAGNSSDADVPGAAIDAYKVINVNKDKITETCNSSKWKVGKHQPRWCRIMPGGVGDYVYILNTHFKDLERFIISEVSGKSNITESIDTIVVAMGNWDSLTPMQKPQPPKHIRREKTLSRLNKAIAMLGKLQLKGKTIIWRTSGFRSPAKKSTEFFLDVTTNAVDQIDSIATRLQKENNKVSNLTCLNWAEAVYPRSFGSERIEGDTDHHYGLQVRLALIQMITNHLASRQGLEF
jgi:hypothetical protein